MKRAALVVLALAAATACKTPAGPASIVPEAESVDAFSEAFVDLYCAEWATCNTSGDPCPVTVQDPDPNAPACVFDSTAADACLTGAWGCDSDAPGVEFPEAPPACAEVCDDP